MTPNQYGLARRTKPNMAPVLIGYFGPNEPNHPQGGNIWNAASLAIEQANQAGGYRGRPFQFVSGWSENPWGSGVKDLTKMAYQDQVLAMIGGIDGPSTHLAEQVVAKARLPLLSGANADRTANLANVSWMFSALPGHHLQASALVQAIQQVARDKRFLVISAVDHDSHILTSELTRCFEKNNLQPRYHFEFKPGRANHSEMISEINSANVEAAVIIAPLLDSASLCLTLRQGGFAGTLFGGPCMSRSRFVKMTGKASEGVVFPLLYESTPQTAAWKDLFVARFKRPVDYLSAHTHDTVNLLVSAIRASGLNRDELRTQIEKLSPWQGVTGTIAWDKQGSNTRPVQIGTIVQGQVKRLSR